LLQSAQGAPVPSPQVSEYRRDDRERVREVHRRPFRYQGYKTTLTLASGDLELDVVAVLGADRIAIQCKRHNRDISRTAVSDAVAGQTHYGCNRAMVVTNRHFTPGAKQLARSTDCILIGRSELARWIQEFQQAA
jgi:HJR/Mrr/RecB family endonuclease